MVEAEGEALDGADGDDVGAVLVGDDEGFFVEAADAEDGDLGLVDDGCAELLAEDAGVGEGEGAAGVLWRMIWLPADPRCRPSSCAPCWPAFKAVPS